jgi:BirA family biotin operon repressor/biotin-[acetyl-CoA-carboxylase] ligase
VRSTNNVALAAGRGGADTGLVVVAEVQTAGRGRLERRWHAPAGTCLLMSLLLRSPRPFASSASRLPMLCGLALVDAVRSVAGVPVSLKWPNDVIVTDGAPLDPPATGWGKLAGMLSEVGLSDDGEPAFLVVGVGVNVNVPATTVSQLVALLDGFLSRTEARYEAWVGGEDPLADWRDELAWLGTTVEVQGPHGAISGRMTGVDDDGALLLTLSTGERRRFTVGDVSLRPQRPDRP